MQLLLCCAAPLFFAIAATVPHTARTETKRAAWKQFGIENGVNVFVHVVPMKTAAPITVASSKKKIVVLNFLFVKSRNEQYSKEASNSKSIGGEHNEIKHIDTKSVALVMCAKVIYSHHHSHYARTIELPEQFAAVAYSFYFSFFSLKKILCFVLLSFSIFCCEPVRLLAATHSFPIAACMRSSEDFAAKIPTAIRH